MNVCTNILIQLKISILLSWFWGRQDVALFGMHIQGSRFFGLGSLHHPWVENKAIPQAPIFSWPTVLVNENPTRPCNPPSNILGSVVDCQDDFHPRQALSPSPSTPCGRTNTRSEAGKELLCVFRRLHKRLSDTSGTCTHNNTSNGDKHNRYTLGVCRKGRKWYLLPAKPILFRNSKESI